MMILVISAGIGLITVGLILWLAHRDAYTLMGIYGLDDGAGDSWLKRFAQANLADNLPSHGNYDSASSSSTGCYSDSGGDSGCDGGGGYSV